MNVKVLSSILDYPHPGLDPAVWGQDGKLLPQQKEVILSRLNTNLQKLNLQHFSEWAIAVHLIGSLTTYQYLSKSDCDVHIYVDIKKFITTEKPEMSTEEVATYFDEVWGDVFDDKTFYLKDTKHPVEFYFVTPKVHENTDNVGIYDIINEVWVKEPIVVPKDFDIEQSKPKFIEDAAEMAGEIDISIGSIKRQISRIEELQETIQAWDDKSKKLFQEKLNTKLEQIEIEIQEMVQIKLDLIETRHSDKFDAHSEDEIKFKYLQKFGYFALISELKDLLQVKEDVIQVTEDKIPEIKEIVDCTKEAALAEPDHNKLMIDFDKTIANNTEDHGIGDPMPGVKEAFERLKSEGWNIIIYSGRANTQEGVDDIKEFMNKYEIPYDEIFVGKPIAEYYIDDRNIVFTNWKDVVKTVDAPKTEKKAHQSLVRVWISPEGHVHQVQNVMHGLWAEENYNLSSHELINEGWVRIGDSYEDTSAFNIELKSLGNIPDFVNDFVASNYKGGNLEVEDNNQTVTIDSPFPNLQTAIKKALARKRMGKIAQHNVSYDYTSTHFVLPKEIAQSIIEWSVKNIPNEDLYDDETSRYGRELESHITVLFGLLTNDPKGIEELLKDEKPVRVKFKKTKVFENDMDSIFIEVDSEDIERLNKKFKTLDNEDQQPDYHPHCTVAYVKSGLGDKYTGEDILDGLELELDTLKFSPKEGDPVFIELGKKQKKEAAFPEFLSGGNNVGWVLRNGLFIEITDDFVEHGDYVMEHPEFFNIAHLDPDNSWRNSEKAIENGATRSAGIFKNTLWLQTKDLQSLSAAVPFITDSIKSSDLESVNVETLGKEYYTASAESFLDNGMSSFHTADPAVLLTSKQAAFMPSIVQAPDNHWTPDSDVEIPLDPDTVSDEETFYTGNIVNKPVSKSIWERLMDMFKDDDDVKEASVEKQADVITDVLKLVQETGGATWNFSQGNLAGTPNYAVSIYPEHTVIVQDKLTPQDLESYVATNKDLLSQPENSLGIWKSGNNYYLDISRTIPNLERAKELGKKHNQISIFDLKNFVEIPTGGTGKVQSKQAAGSFLVDGVKVYENPSKEEARGLRLRSKEKALRVFIDPWTMDAYVWDAHELNHDDVYQFLGYDIGEISEDNLHVLYEDADIDSYYGQLNHKISSLELSKHAKVEDVEGIKVFINPTPEQVHAFLQKSRNKQLRALIDPLTGNIFAWDAWAAEHDKMIRYFDLNIDWEGDDGTSIRHVFNDADINYLFEAQADIKQKVQKAKVSSLNKEAYQGNAWWITAEGDVHEVRPPEFGDMTHYAWLRMNSDFLKQNYGIILPDDGTEGPALSDWIIANAGWTRIGDDIINVGVKSVTTPDIKHIPKVVDSLLSKFLQDGDRIEISDQIRSDNFVVVQYPYKSLQQAVNYALRHPEMQQAASKKAYQSPPTASDDVNQDLEPTKPLPTTFEWGTNDENLNWRYPWKFMKKPTGPNYSNEGEVDEMLVDDEQFGDDKPLSKHQSALKTAASPFRAWIAPDGKIYKLRDGEAHGSWIRDNLDFLRKKYDVDYDYKGETGWVTEIDDLILNHGWIRVDGSSYSEFNLMVGDLNTIPSTADIILSYLNDNDILYVETTRGNVVKLQAPFKSVQKAVNRALVERKMQQAASLELSKHAYDDDDTGFPKAPKWEQDWNEVAWAKPYRSDDEGYWITPDGKVFQISMEEDGGVHGNWLLRNNNMLKQNYGIDVTKVWDSPPDYTTLINYFVNRGWLRVTYDKAVGRVAYGIYMKDLNNIPPAVDTFIMEHGGVSKSKGVMLEDTSHKHITIYDPEFLAQGLDKSVKREMHDKQFQNQPMAAGLKRTAMGDIGYWISPKGEVHNIRPFTHIGWISENRKALEKTYPFPVTMDDQDIFDKLIEQYNWIRIGDSPLNNQSLNIQMADFSNIPSVVDNVLATIFKPGMKLDVEEGGTFTQTGHVVQITEPFPTLQRAVQKALYEERAKAALLDLPLSKVAMTMNGLWVAPDGTAFEVRGDGNWKSHGEWVYKNLNMLKTKYGIQYAVKGADYFDTAKEMLEKGWARIGDTSHSRSAALVGVEVANIKNIPSYIDDALATFAQDGQEIIISDLNDNWTTITWPVKSVQSAVRRAVRGGITASSNIFDVEGYRVFRNPTAQQADNLFRNSTSDAMRYFVAPDDSLYMWDAYELEHASVMEALGVRLTSDNYAGAGTIINEGDAGRIAQRFQDLHRKKKKAALEKFALQQQDVVDFYLMSLLPPSYLSSANKDSEHYDGFKIFENIVMTLREEYIRRGMHELGDEARTTAWVHKIPDAEMPDELKPYFEFHKSGYDGNYNGDPDNEDNEDEVPYSCENCATGLYEDDAYSFNDSMYCDSCYEDKVQDALKREALYCTDDHKFILPDWLKQEALGEISDEADRLEDRTHEGHNLVNYVEGRDIDVDYKKNQKKQLKLPLTYPGTSILTTRNDQGEERYYNVSNGWVTDRNEATQFTPEQQKDFGGTGAEGVSWVAASKKSHRKKTAGWTEYQGGPYWQAPTNFSSYTSTDFYKIFKYAPWKDQYGGPLWAEVARTIYEMQNTTDLNKLVVLIDHFHDLGHNTGKLLDKFPEWHDWFKNLLDMKAQKNSLNYLLSRASRPVKDLVMDFLRVNQPGWREREQPARAASLFKKFINKLAYGPANNVLIVCSGNTCRSPMAENILRSIRPDLNIVSRGLYVGRGGYSFAPGVEEVLKEKNIPYQEHKSAQVSLADVQNADIIFAMEYWQMDEIERQFPAAIGKTFLMGDTEIGDPIGGNVEEYKKVRDQITKALEKMSSANSFGLSKYADELYPGYNKFIKKHAFQGHAYWIDPNGKVFTVRGEGGGYVDHWTWIGQNEDMLAKEYGLKYEGADGRTLGNMLFPKMIEQGWIRIGDAGSYNSRWGVTMKDIHHIPKYLEDLLMSFLQDGAQVDFVDELSNDYARVVYPFRNLQKEVNEDIRFHEREDKAASYKEAGNLSNTYTDDQMEQIYDEQHAEDQPGGDGSGGNVYHDWNQSTNDFPKPEDTERYQKVYLDQLEDGITPPIASYEVTWYFGSPADDNGSM